MIFSKKLPLSRVYFNKIIFYSCQKKKKSLHFHFLRKKVPYGPASLSGALWRNGPLPLFFFLQNGPPLFDLTSLSFFIITFIPLFVRHCKYLHCLLLAVFYDNWLTRSSGWRIAVVFLQTWRALDLVFRSRALMYWSEYQPNWNWHPNCQKHTQTCPAGSWQYTKQHSNYWSLAGNVKIWNQWHWKILRRSCGIFHK